MVILRSNGIVDQSRYNIPTSGAGVVGGLIPGAPSQQETPFPFPQTGDGSTKATPHEPRFSSAENDSTPCVLTRTNKVKGVRGLKIGWSIGARAVKFNTSKKFCWAN